MKILKINKLIFITQFLLWVIPCFFLLVVFVISICRFGFQYSDLAFLVILLPAFFLFFILNYYLYDKDTIIEIDKNGNIIYNNIKKIDFHVHDIDSCTELFTRFSFGYTELHLKNGCSLYITSFISMQFIYEMNPKIKREPLGLFWPIILRRENSV